MRHLLILLLLTATASARPGGAGAPFVPPTRSTGSGGGGDITGVTAGVGLLGGATSGNATLSADTTYLQRLVSGLCAAGSSIRAINSDGTVVCETDDVGTGTVTNVSTLAPLQGGPITTTGTVSLINCPANDIYKMNAGGTAWACVVDAGITGTITTGDLIVATGAGTVGNYAGSTPAACSAGQVLTRVTSSATGAITLTCTAIGTAGGITGGSLTINQTVKATGATSIGNAWPVDDATTWGVASKLTVDEATGNLHGFGTLAIDGTSTLTGNVTAQGTLTVNGNLNVHGDPSLGDSSLDSLTFNATAASALDMGTHQIHDVTDGTSLQDAVTLNQLTTATTNEITGTLTSGTVPVATGAHTLGDSSIKEDVNNVTVNTNKLIVAKASGSVTSLGFVEGNAGVYSGANSQVYLTKGTGKEGLGCFFATNATATCKISPVGYSEGQTQFRDLDIEDGEGNSVAYYTGSSKAVEFHGAATLDSDVTIGGTDATLQLTDGGTHIVAKDGAGRPTIANCGTGATLVGTDESGLLTIGTSPTTSCAVTFNRPVSSNASCVVTLRSAGAHILNYGVATTGITGLSDESALSSGMKVDYECKDH